MASDEKIERGWKLKELCLYFKVVRDSKGMQSSEIDGHSRATNATNDQIFTLVEGYTQAHGGPGATKVYGGDGMCGAGRWGKCQI